MPEHATLNGRKVLVTAGGTREPIDPVRYLGNRSSGRMGGALAAVAAGQGAQVTLVSTVDVTVPTGTGLIRVNTADEMAEVVWTALDDLDVLFMAAAVADYRPEAPALRKLKKGAQPMQLTLVPTTDILASLRGHPRRGAVFVVGFAAETDDLVDNATAKLRSKGLDLIVVNDVGREDIGMGSDHNEVTVVGAEGVIAHLPRAPKERIAAEIIRIAAARAPR